MFYYMQFELLLIFLIMLCSSSMHVSHTLQPSCWAVASRRHMVLARCRWSPANAECIPNNTHRCTIYDKDAAIEDGYHMEVKEEERKWAHAWYMHGRERGWERGVGWENANVFGTMSKGAYNVEGGVAGDRRTIRRAMILRVYLGTLSKGR